MNNLIKKIATAVTLSTALAGSAEAADIICNREIEVCVPHVVTMQQVRRVSQEVPVVCYQTEKRLVNRTIVEPTCDPCNPFVRKTCQQEVLVRVPYVSKQIIERQVVENVPVVQYHREKRIVQTRVHVDDCPAPSYMPPTCAPVTNSPNYLPHQRHHHQPHQQNPGLVPVPSAPTPANPKTKPNNSYESKNLQDKVASNNNWRPARD